MHSLMLNLLWLFCNLFAITTRWPLYGPVNDCVFRVTCIKELGIGDFYNECEIGYTFREYDFIIHWSGDIRKSRCSRYRFSTISRRM